MIYAYFLDHYIRIQRVQTKPIYPLLDTTYDVSAQDDCHGSCTCISYVREDEVMLNYGD
jgi:hypothetical protein